MKVANIILQQLGGNRFIAMTGASHFVSDGNTLRMNLPRNASKANRLYITLAADDTYTMRFFYYRAGGWRVNHKTMTVTETKTVERDVYKIEGVYFDQLQSIFTKQTGLYTHF